MTGCSGPVTILQSKTFATFAPPATSSTDCLSARPSRRVSPRTQQRLGLERPQRPTLGMTLRSIAPAEPLHTSTSSSVNEKLRAKIRSQRGMSETERTQVGLFENLNFVKFYSECCAYMEGLY
jgi:hypothetical protein